MLILLVAILIRSAALSVVLSSSFLLSISLAVTPLHAFDVVFVVSLLDLFLGIDHLAHKILEHAKSVVSLQFLDLLNVLDLDDLRRGHATDFNAILKIQNLLPLLHHDFMLPFYHGVLVVHIFLVALCLGSQRILE